jgi:hypothetical protein
MKNVVPGFEVLWRANTLTLAQCHSYQRGFGNSSMRRFACPEAVRSVSLRDCGCQGVKSASPTQRRTGIAFEK